jgi:hypothetical protein
MKTRLKRYRHFAAFYKDANSKFNRLASADKRHRELEPLYSLCVTPGGRFGGLDERLVEIFYGNRPIDRVTVLSEIERDGHRFPSPTSKLVKEHGATLQYRRVIDGKVICLLLPAGNDEMRPSESAICLSRPFDPARLDDSDYLTQGHWNCLMSYMQCTSIDGSPTLWDRIRIGRMRFCKPLLVGQETRGARIWTWLGRVLSFSMTVGLSGFLLAIILMLFSKK